MTCQTHTRRIRLDRHAARQIERQSGCRRYPVSRCRDVHPDRGWFTRASAVQAVLRGNGGVVEKTIACGPVGIGVVTGRMAQSIADGCSVQHGIGIGKGSLRRSIGRPPRSGVDRAGHITHVKSGLPRNRGRIARLWRNRKRIGDHFGRSIVQRAPAGMGLLQKAQVTIRVDPGNRFQPEVPRGRDGISRPFQRVSQVQGAFGLFAVLCGRPRIRKVSGRGFRCRSSAKTRIAQRASAAICSNALPAASIERSMSPCVWTRQLRLCRILLPVKNMP